MDSKLRSFRSGVSLLKKQGLIPARLDNTLKLDARSALPSMKVKGKRLDSIVKKFDAVVSGKATALPADKKDLPKFRKAGFETSGGRIIVPHAATEKARISKGQVTIRGTRGIERVQIPVPFHNLPQFLRDIKRNHKTINALKGSREYFGIRFMGGQRANFYSDIRDLIDDLNRYQSVMAATRRYKQEEIYKHFELLRINTAGTRHVEAMVEERKRTMTKAYNKKHAKKVREKIARDPERYADYKAKAAERARDYRKRVKKNSKQSARIKAGNRKRQQKLRDSMKPKRKRK